MVTLGNLTGVVALTWEFGANGYTAMNLMGLSGAAQQEAATLLGVGLVSDCLLYTSDAADE